LDKYYIGFTQELLSSRLERHNSGFYGSSKYTVIASDWEIYLAFSCSSVSQGLAVERHIKRMKSRRYIENLKAYPEMRKKLLELYE
jgi:putative endonuclease